jgi:hypothetical protein
MSVSNASKLAKVPTLAKGLQDIANQLAQAMLLFEDIKKQIDDLEVGSFTHVEGGPTYETGIQAIPSLKHVDGPMIDWTIGKLNELNAWWEAEGQGRMAAINNLRTGAQ